MTRTEQQNSIAAEKEVRTTKLSTRSEQTKLQQPYNLKAKEKTCSRKKVKRFYGREPKENDNFQQAKVG